MRWTKYDFEHSEIYLLVRVFNESSSLKGKLVFLHTELKSRKVRKSLGERIKTATRPGYKAF